MTIESPVLLAVALGCLTASFIWLRSAFRLERSWRRIERLVGEAGRGQEAASLAFFAFRKELHTGLLYLILAGALSFGSLSERPEFDIPMLLLAAPIAGTLVYGRRFLRQAEQVEARTLLERRAEEVIEQEATAPRAWAARLAPEDLPPIDGFEIGHVYEPGSGLMAGDFYDLFQTTPTRLAAVIGDVSGHGIEPSITAFQVKYLLRVFLREYRDPAQALEKLNEVLSGHGGSEEFASLCVALFDLEAGTVRVASAGHPPMLLWHDNEIRYLRSTGPLLTLDPKGTYTSKETELLPGDVLLMYTDGLVEARSGDQLFGDERVAQMLRRDPGQQAEVICKSLLEAARDFAAAPLGDDVAILAIRRT
ncbi:MAG TPA: PP2C family protein-serine/threonine phosphatase [Acidimicrobiales bacterium]|jgi:phosphoserine phosphatase RsbU/P|nr:PP2C family protein-serine/threonine phosphatase [Acidimicrobiales bacterium]